MAGSVNACRFFQRTGNTVLEIIAGNDGIADCNTTGQEHRPDGLHDAGLLHNQVGRDQTATEVHGDNEENADDFFAGQVTDGQRISYQVDQGHRINGTDHGIQNAVAITPNNIGFCKHSLVAVQRELTGKQEGFACIDVIGIRERCHQNVIQRVSDNNQDKQREDHQNNVTGAVTQSAEFTLFSF